jgi:hypothetical protein
MGIGSFARGALAELDPDDLVRMLELNETLLVEHKSDVGSESVYGIASNVAAFANTIGGWLLLGVRDGRPLENPPSWAVEDAPSLVDFVRDRLRGEVDPLPAFEARVIELPVGRVGVVRVYESSDTPHVLVRTGAVFVREVAGSTDAAAVRRPGASARGDREYRAAQIRSRAQLVELATRGQHAASRVARLVDPGKPLPLVTQGLGLSFDLISSGGWQPRMSNFAGVFVRVAPYTLPPRFRAWTTTADAAAIILESAEDLAQRRGLSAEWVDPHPAGVSITVQSAPGLSSWEAADHKFEVAARLVIDGAGVVGAMLQFALPTQPEGRPRLALDAVATSLIAPAVQASTKILEGGEFLGRALCQIDLVACGMVVGLEGQGQRPTAFHVPTSTDVTLPISEGDVIRPALLAVNALARSAGLPAWDRPPGLH